MAAPIGVHDLHVRINALETAAAANLAAGIMAKSANDVCIVEQAGAPVDGAAGSFFGVAGPGSLLIDRTNKNVYINANTKASPTWKLITRAA